MKRQLSRLQWHWLSFATVAQAAPKDNTWYTGAKLGWSQYHDTGFIPNNGPTHENQLGAGALVVTRLTRMLVLKWVTTG